jgi:hypothetical protein
VRMLITNHSILGQDVCIDSYGHDLEPV